MVGSISGSTYVTFDDVSSWKWNWELNEGKNPSYKMVKGLIVAQVSFVQVLLFVKESSIDFIYNLIVQNMIFS